MIEAQRRWFRGGRLLRQPVCRLLMAAAVLTSLQGCVEMVVGTAVVGAIAATDRRTLGAQTEDKAITVKAETRLPGLVGEAGHVNVSSFNRKVLITGEVRDAALKAAVESEFAGMQGVLGVVNELGIGPRSTYTSRGNDTVITSKVKASFVDTKQLSVNAIKVVTERANVYLMGRVTETEGQRAAEVARGVPGVERVVKVFDYITEEELRQITRTN